MKTFALKIKQFLFRPFFLGIAVFLISFVVYIQTLLPSMGYSGDTAKFQFIGKILGIPHPPGYPLYIMLNYLFGKLPIGNLAYRINLMSACFASLTVAFLFFVIRRLTHNAAIALMAALAFGFSHTFWSQAVIAEVYTLHTCFLSIVILFLILWAQERRRIYFYLACCFYAISFGNHLLMITVLPGFAVFVILTDYKILSSKKTIVWVSTFIVVGMLQYSYIFIRLYQGTTFSEYSETFHHNTITYFFDFVMGKQFRAKMFAFSLENILTERIPLFFGLFRKNVFIEGIISGCIGIWVLLRKQTTIAVLLLLIMIGNITYALNYDIEDIFVYFIPTYFVFAIFIGYCLEALWRIGPHVWKSSIGTQIFRMIVVTSLGLYCWKLVTTNYPVVDQSQNTYEDFFTSTVFECFEKPGIILPPQQPEKNYRWTMFYLYNFFEQEKHQNEPIPLPGYFLSTSETEVFPQALWEPHELAEYLTRNIHVYVQDDTDKEALIEYGYLVRDSIFYQGENMKHFLQNIRENQILLLSIKYEATEALDHDVGRILATFGLHQNLLDKPFHSYAAIGVKGAGSFSGIEEFGLGTVSLILKKGEKIGRNGVVSPVNITITSNGASMEHVNEIRVNGKNYSQNIQGMNIVVLDSENGEVLQTTTFNSHLSLYRDEVRLWKIVGKVQGDNIVLLDPDEKTEQFWSLAQNTINLTNKNHRKYLLKGWLQTKEWGTAAMTPSQLLYYLEQKEETNLFLYFVPGNFPLTNQKNRGEISISINGVLARSITVPPKHVEHVVLPAHAIKKGLNLLTLLYSALDSASPQEHIPLGIRKLVFEPSHAVKPGIY
jgi:hypothetical protein